MIARYRELVAKVDAAFNAIQAQHTHAMKCGRGCAACCKPKLTVCAVERAAIRDYLVAQPDTAAAVSANAAADPHRGKACAMLDSSGSCLIYPVRPLVCRSHGAPLSYKPTKGLEQRDVCPLNFTDGDLASLPPNDFINLDTLNTLLALINKAFAPAASLARFPLDLAGITGNDPA